MHMAARKKKMPLWLVMVLVLLLVALLGMLLPQHEDELVLRPSVPDVVFEDFHTIPEQPDMHPPARPNTPKPSEAVPPAQPVRQGIALIIDDVGYDLSALRKILALHVPVAIAVLPDSPHPRRAAEMAHQAGQMVMLHLPMEPDTPKYRDSMDASFLRADMTSSQLRDTLLRNLSQVPYVEGVNNHMGSHLTRMASAMDDVMQVIGEQGLFFVDSRTSGKSVAADAARRAGLAWASRKIFLDHQLDKAYMLKAWQQAENCLAKGLACVVIGHPHPETVAFLEQHLGGQQRLQLKPLRQLLHVARADLAKQSLAAVK